VVPPYPKGAAGGFWGPPPGSINSLTAVAALREIQDVLKTNNPIYPYAPNVNVFHCPGDPRSRNCTPGNGWAWDSYSRTQNVGGEDHGGDYWGALATYKKMGQIRNSSMTIIFIEDADPRVGYNEGSWVLRWNTGTIPGSFTWVDPPAVYHGDGTTFGFADGHVEYHRWHDGNLINAGRAAGQGVSTFYFNGPTSGPDYSFMRERYQHPNWN
jgi:prepilin-type processing-associated H-X9-DG protein